MIGCAERSKTYKLSDPGLQRVVGSREAAFDGSKASDMESIGISSSSSSVELLNHSEELVYLNNAKDTGVHSDTPNDTPKVHDDHEVVGAEPEVVQSDDIFVPTQEDTNAQADPTPLRRSTLIKRKPDWWHV